MISPPTPYRGHSYATVLAPGGWYAEVYLEDEVLFTTGSPCQSECLAAIVARELIDRITY
jgi:hypothetical protein